MGAPAGSPMQVKGSPWQVKYTGGSGSGAWHPLTPSWVPHKNVVNTSGLDGVQDGSFPGAVSELGMNFSNHSLLWTGLDDQIVWTVRGTLEIAFFSSSVLCRVLSLRGLSGPFIVFFGCGVCDL